VDDVVHVSEDRAIRMCHRLAERGFLFGGSTGSIVAGALTWLAEQDSTDLTAVAISPDLGERYLDTVYHQNWLRGDRYGEAVPSTGPVASVSTVSARHASHTNGPYRRMPSGTL